MNTDYLQNKPDHHVHWHFIPRYNHKVGFENLVFEVEGNQRFSMLTKLKVRETLFLYTKNRRFLKFCGSKKTSFFACSEHEALETLFRGVKIL